MSDFSDSEFPIPDSNVENVAINLCSRAIDLDGSGLVEVLRLLLVKAEEIKRRHMRSAELSRQLLAGESSIDQQDFDSVLLELWFDTSCLKWLLAHSLRSLSDQLKTDVLQQSKTPRITKIVYSEDGDVESFELA